jgi:hypothetical protein
VPNSLLEIGGCARDTYWDGRACLGVTHSSQASAEHFHQCAEFLLLRNRGLGPLAVLVLSFCSPGGPPLPLAPPCNRQRPFLRALDRCAVLFAGAALEALQLWR